MLLAPLAVALSLAGRAAVDDRPGGIAPARQPVVAGTLPNLNTVKYLIDAGLDDEIDADLDGD